MNAFMAAMAGHDAAPPGTDVAGWHDNPPIEHYEMALGHDAGPVGEHYETALGPRPWPRRRAARQSAPRCRVARRSPSTARPGDPWLADHPHLTVDDRAFDPDDEPPGAENDIWLVHERSAAAAADHGGG
jgi:hypothetical protein